MTLAKQSGARLPANNWTVDQGDAPTPDLAGVVGTKLLSTKPKKGLAHQ